MTEFQSVQPGGESMPSLPAASVPSFSRAQKISLFVLRLGLGWLMFYAGITKVLDPEWSATGYLSSAKTFPALFEWLASPANIGWVNFMNEWGLTLLGISLLLGVFVRLSSVLGALLMLFYYFPVLEFPYPNAHSFIVDDHIIYVLVLILFAAVRAGRVWGLDQKFLNLPMCDKFPKLRNLVG